MKVRRTNPSSLRAVVPQAAMVRGRDTMTRRVVNPFAGDRTTPKRQRSVSAPAEDRRIRGSTVRIAFVVREDAVVLRVDAVGPGHDSPASSEDIRSNQLNRNGEARIILFCGRVEAGREHCLVGGRRWVVRDPQARSSTSITMLWASGGGEPRKLILRAGSRSFG